MTNAIRPEPGMVVYVNFWGRWRHYGIVSERTANGKPTIIANAFRTGGVAEVTWDCFADGRTVYIARPPATVHPLVVVYNARQLMGKPYRLFSSNCEHFVHRCHGLEPSSNQAVLLGVLGIGVAAVLLVSLAAD
jgi:hypothetical protein